MRSDFKYSKCRVKLFNQNKRFFYEKTRYYPLYVKSNE